MGGEGEEVEEEKEENKERRVTERKIGLEGREIEKGGGSEREG